MKFPWSKKVATAIATSALRLPEWAKVVEGSDKVGLTIEVNTSAAYREWLPKLGAPTTDQYWLECAYQCTKMQLQDALVGTAYDPRTAGKPVEFRFKRAEEFKLDKHPPGRGVAAA